ncbi:MAG: flippase-like domain-containing protein [Deltaproteobacteria bacterium]|nr:flippase-like domain-containing protein [Deltaproteobacteria bacterium]
MIWIIRGIDDPRQVWQSMWEAAMLPLLLVIPLVVASYFLRAVRWCRFIGEPVSRFYAFSSVLIGYAVNGVIPRGGEVVRIVNMNRTTGISIARLLTTLVAERMFDLLALLGLIGLSVMTAGDRVAAEFQALEKIALVGLASVAVGCIALVLLARYPTLLSRISGRVAQKIHPKLGARVEEFTEQGIRGLAFLRSWKQVAAVFVETLGIWFLLWSAFAAALFAYGLFQQVELQGSVVTFSITNAGFLVPSAGAIGAFHKLGLDSLVLLYQTDPAGSLAFVTVLHLLAIYLVPVGGGVLTWIVQSMLRRKEVGS